jgi:uncharacterized protein (TIGR02466 family)
MAIETWFPLAVYFEDLRPPPEVRRAMLAHLEPFVARHDATASTRFAWTGDTKSCWQIHRAEPFAWLRREVEHHTIAFARALGVNLSVVGFYFQRSWPVLSRPEEQVSRHSHPNASISAVYFLKTPRDPERAGRLVFHNVAEQNGLGIGFGTRDTRGISGWNPLNYQQARYLPLENRLLLFPSRQPHSVEPNHSDELRISLSFDVAVTCSRHADPGRHEFLSPPPEDWCEFGSRVEEQLRELPHAASGER